MRHLHFLLLGTVALTGPAPAQTFTPAETFVSAIIRADYEGNRAALERLYDDLARVAPAAGDRRQAAQLHYWLGFAKWRRALNGFNANAAPSDLERDLRAAVAAFEASRAADPSFTDAAIGLIGSLQNLTFVHRNDRAAADTYVKRFVPLFTELAERDPANPRLAWLAGGGRWFLSMSAPPEERAKMQADAFDTYRRGLEQARRQQPPASVLEPVWGEPELLMSLAWSSLNQATPDAAAAEKYAAQALVLVPHWHYLKNVLLPQIHAATRQQFEMARAYRDWRGFPDGVYCGLRRSVCGVAPLFAWSCCRS